MPLVFLVFIIVGYGCVAEGSITFYYNALEIGFATSVVDVGECFAETEGTFAYFCERLRQDDARQCLTRVKRLRVNGFNSLGNYDTCKFFTICKRTHRYVLKR